MRHLNLKSSKVLKVWDQWLEFSYCSKIWHVHQQQCCWGTSQISKQYQYFNTQTRNFWDFARPNDKTCYLILIRAPAYINSSRLQFKHHSLNSLAPGRFIVKIALRWMPAATRPYWCYINIGSGNGLVLSGNKPLPEPMLTQIYVAKWRH